MWFWSIEIHILISELPDYPLPHLDYIWINHSLINLRILHVFSQQELQERTRLLLVQPMTRLILMPSVGLTSPLTVGVAGKSTERPKSCPQRSIADTRTIVGDCFYASAPVIARDGGSTFSGCPVISTAVQSALSVCSPPSLVCFSLSP